MSQSYGQMIVASMTRRITLMRSCIVLWLLPIAYADQMQTLMIYRFIQMDIIMIAS